MTLVEKLKMLVEKVLHDYEMNLKILVVSHNYMIIEDYLKIRCCKDNLSLIRNHDIPTSNPIHEATSCLENVI